MTKPNPGPGSFPGPQHETTMSATTTTTDISKTINGVLYYIDIETTITHHKDWGDGFPGASYTDEKVVGIVREDETVVPREQWPAILNAPNEI